MPRNFKELSLFIVSNILKVFLPTYYFIRSFYKFTTVLLVSFGYDVIERLTGIKQSDFYLSLKNIFIGI